MKHILDKYNLPYEYIEFENISIAVIKNESERYNFIQYINGLNVYNGGKPIEWVEQNLVSSLLKLFPKKYSNIKKNDVLAKITLVVIFKNMKKPRFEDQVKSICNNGASQFKDISSDVDFVKFSKQLYKNKSLIKNITEYADVKAEFEARKALKDLAKPVKEVDIDKYKPAIEEQKYLVISEGKSASSSVESALGREVIGFYPLKGKIMNCIKTDVTKIKKSVEIRDLIDILGIDLTKENDINYENIVIATDSDLDGYHITSLILTLFVKYRPDLIKKEKIKYLKTPVVVGYSKEIPKYFMFDLEDYYTNKSKHKNIEWKYKKGLSSLDESDWEELFKDGLENCLETLEWSDDLPEVFDIYMGDNAQKRKDILIGSSLDINMV